MDLSTFCYIGMTYQQIQWPALINLVCSTLNIIACMIYCCCSVPRSLPTLFLHCHFQERNLNFFIILLNFCGLEIQITLMFLCKENGILKHFIKFCTFHLPLDYKFSFASWLQISALKLLAILPCKIGLWILSWRNKSGIVKKSRIF